MKWASFFFYPLFLCSAPFETIVEQMTLDEKIGQILMPPLCPTRGEKHWNDWLELIEKYHIGNGIVKQSDPLTQVSCIAYLQEKSPRPLLIGADAEWGLGMRMSDTLSFPKNLTLGAIQDQTLLFKLGEEIGRQARLVGIHLNLAPVADVNNNPANPIIGMRSFGDDPRQVSLCVSSFSRGLQSAGVLGCAKHFPGHGDTSVDSHRDLPLIPHSLDRLEEVEWVPFRRAIDEGISAIMTAHLLVPAIDPLLPSSLSSNTAQILRSQFSFGGLIVTDGLNMKALTGRFTPQQIALLARKAGSDLLLYGDHIAPKVDEILHETIPQVFHALKEGYLSGELDLKELDESVLRILKAKENLFFPSIDPHLLSLLHSPEALALKKQLFEEALTLVGESAFPIPLDASYLSFGGGDLLGDFIQGDGETVVVAIHEKEALTGAAIEQILKLGDRAIVCLFATPYLLNEFSLPKTVLVAYENDPDAQMALLEVLRGEREAKGHLPIALDGPNH